MSTRQTLLICSLLSFALLTSCAQKNAGLQAGPHFEKDLQTALIQAKPGTVIELPEGKFDMTGTLSLTVPNVTIRGKGIGKTILSYRNQTSGSAGLLATGNGFTLEDLSIQDTKGDGVKVNGSDGVVIRRVRTEWTNGPNEKNGSYGIYPVQCTNLLVEESSSSGAADAGIYVGQSKNLIVRRNRAEFNVAGIEIENSENADVYENVATNNSGGLLIFALPDLPIKISRNTRVFNNQVYNNNTPNFAPKGNLVGKLPTGTGLQVMATHNAEVFNNVVHDNDSANIFVISYFSLGIKIQDAGYNPYLSEVYIHDNQVGPGGAHPAGPMGEALAAKLGKPLPGIQWDGVEDPKLKGNTQLCIQNNGDAKFVNGDAGNDYKKISVDVKPHACQLPGLAAITIPKVAAASVGGMN
jgi:parallel beta-helix repeat protein